MSREKVTTLVIEDNPATANQLIGVLEEELHYNYIVKLVGSLASATVQLSDIVAAVYELIILDLKLPNSEGVQLVEQIRAMAPHAALVVWSGLSGADVEFEALKAAADLFITKADRSNDALRSSIRQIVYTKKRLNAAIEAVVGPQKELSKELDRKIEANRTDPFAPPYK